MSLNPDDNNSNKHKLMPIIEELTKFYLNSATTNKKLKFYTDQLLTHLDYHEVILQQDDRLKELKTLLSRIVGCDDEELIMRNLHSWVEQYKQAELETKQRQEKFERERHYDIGMLLTVNNDNANYRHGSLEDCKKALHHLIKAPDQATDEVVIVSPIMRTLRASDDPTLDKTKPDSDDPIFQKMLVNAIKPILSNNVTKKILIPVLCDDSTWRYGIWRLINIDINEKSRLIDQVILWDYNCYKDKYIENDYGNGYIRVTRPDQDALKKLAIFEDLRFIARGLNPKINDKNIIASVSKQHRPSNLPIVSGPYIPPYTMDCVIQQAVKVLIKKQDRSPQGKKFCELTLNAYDSYDARHLRAEIIKLIRKNNAVLSPVQNRRLGLFDANVPQTPQAEVPTDTKGKKHAPM